MNEGNLKIRNVEIDGFGNLSHVIMRELGDRIVLEGVNGVGKTMILTAIRAALEGKTGLPDRPLSEWIKSGHENALIKLDLADGTVVRFSIRVIITAANFDLQIKEVADDGTARKIPGGPMAFLKTVVNAIAFRPQAWRKKSDAEQLEEMFNFFPGLKDKLAANSKKLSESELERARLLARAKVLRLDAERAPFTPNLPAEEIEASEILGKLSAAREHNKGLETIKGDQKTASNEYDSINKEIVTLKTQRTRTKEMLEKLQKQLEQQDTEIENAEKRLDIAAHSVSDTKDAVEKFHLILTEPFEQELTDLQKKNALIRQNQNRAKLLTDLENTDTAASLEYNKIKNLHAERSQIMSTAEIPVDGLSIGDNCLLYPNSNMEMVRLSALSDGEFWPVACGLVAAFKPRVKIMIIDNLHDLDKNNFEAMSASATKYGMQTWIHSTLWDEAAASVGSILIRDGKVVEAAA
jgi:ABC-type branched-subunit amino acid transport system ATPase component